MKSAHGSGAEQPDGTRRAADTATLHIGVAGPSSPRLFAADLNLAADELPEGLGGTPVNQLVRAWLDAGYRVTLATLDREHDRAEPITFRGERLTLAVGPYRLRRRARDAFRIERAAIARALSASRAQAVSAHWSYEFALGAIESGVPTLVTVHDVPREIFRMQPTPYRLVRWGMHRRAMARAQGVAFNSPYTKEQLRRPTLERAAVLPNALADDLWSLTDRKPPDASAPRFISVNNGFGEWKNVGRLLEAFSSVLREVPAARMALIGNGFERGGSAMQWSQERGLNQGIEFMGPKSHQETLDLIRGADVLVHPSLEESFGYTLIEAASVGTPVIAGRGSGAVPWVLADGDSGVLIDVTRAGTIADAMIALTRSPRTWTSLRHQAFTSGRARFAASVVAAAYVGELEAIA